MDAEQLGQALYDKMEAEFNEYKSNLLQQTPEQIIKQAYEYLNPYYFVDAGG